MPGAVQAAVEREAALGDLPDRVSAVEAIARRLNGMLPLVGEGGLEVAGNIVRNRDPGGTVASAPLPTVMAYAAVNGRIELVRLSAKVVPHDRP